MITSSAALVVFGVVALIAVIAAAAAVWQVRIARAALSASRQQDANRIDRVESDRLREADSRIAADVAHDLGDLLTAVTGHTELLIASLDPAGTTILEAYEIRRAALRAAHITRPLRTLGGRALSTRPAAFDALGPTIEPARVAEAIVEKPLRQPVLVVEDEPGVRELIRVILTTAGYQVVAVAGPRAALAALRRQPTIDLMLVDVVMPEMNGYDLVAEARTVLPDVHIVFMSAFARDPARHALGEGFIQKPFTAQALTDLIETSLREA